MTIDQKLRLKRNFRDFYIDENEIKSKIKINKINYTGNIYDLIITNKVTKDTLNTINFSSISKTK